MIKPYKTFPVGSNGLFFKSEPLVLGKVLDEEIGFCLFKMLGKKFLSNGGLMVVCHGTIHQKITN